MFKARVFINGRAHKIVYRFRRQLDWALRNGVVYKGRRLTVSMEG